MTPPPAPNASHAWLRVLFAFGLVLAATLRASWSTLDRYFLCDDFAYIGRFHQLTFSEWPQLFIREWSGGIWGQSLPELRPFAALTFLLDAHLWGVNPLGFHLTNFLLDSGCAWLVMLIVWRLHDQALSVGCAAAILFAWHPAHAEPVAWVTGRVDLLGTLAYLAGFLAAGSYLAKGASRRALVAAWLAYLVGCFSKEFCLTLPVAVVGWWIFYREKDAPIPTRRLGWLLGGFVVVAGLFLLCRRIAFGPGSGGVTPLNFFSAAYAERQFDYLRWYLPPFYHFGRDYRPQLVALAPALVSGGLLLGLAILGLWHWRGPATARWRAIAFYVACWYGIATLPLAAAGYFSPRHLYLATAGLAIAIGLLIASLQRRWLTCLLTTGAALFCVARFDHAVAPWRHSARVSERVAAAIARETPQLQPGEVLLLDVPDVHEGAWMWAWSAPFSLRPPFQSTSPAAFLTPPAVHYSPPRWPDQPAFAALAAAPAAVLIRVDDTGAVATRRIARAQLAAPAAQLAHDAARDADRAWRTFLATLPAR